MQVNGSVTNVPFKAPSEVDGQNSTQSPLQSQDQQTSSTSRTSRDTVNISPQAQALSAQKTTNDAAMVVQESARVEPRQTVQNVGQDQQNTQAPPVEPEQTSLTATERPTGTAYATQQQDPSQSPPANPSAQAADTASQSNPLQDATIVTQNVAPQNETTPQKTAPEAPMAAVGGLSAGKGSIDLNV